MSVQLVAGHTPAWCDNNVHGGQDDDHRNLNGIHQSNLSWGKSVIFAPIWSMNSAERRTNLSMMFA